MSVLSEVLKALEILGINEPSTGGGTSSPVSASTPLIWGNITGDINNQTDLIALINALSDDYVNVTGDEMTGPLSILDSFDFRKDGGASSYGTLLRIAGRSDVSNGYAGVTFENPDTNVKSGDIPGDPTHVAVDPNDDWGFGANSLIWAVNDVDNADAVLAIINANYTSSFELDFANNVVRIGNASLGTETDLDVAGDTNLATMPTVGGSSLPSLLEVSTPVCLSIYDPSPTRGSVSDIHGGLNALATADTLGTGDDIVVTKGIGKMIIVVNAGSDLTGTITVTGTTVDRETGAETPADSVNISVDGLTTDTSSTDGNGNTRHAFANAYITSKWFVGSVTISTSDVTLTDVDVYHVSFEQFNDTPSYTIETFDANLLTTNASAEFDAYLYSLVVSGDTCTIVREADLNIGTNGNTALVNRYERLRKGNINKAMNGSSDGIWCEVFYSNSPAYIEDVSLKIWASAVSTVDIA